MSDNFLLMIKLFSSRSHTNTDRQRARKKCFVLPPGYVIKPSNEPQIGVKDNLN